MVADLGEAYRAFTTGVGLITTNGSKGPNVMAAEWTFHVSYEPFLIAVLVDPENATHAAIRETREFGVSLTSVDQVAAMGFAGHFSKHETDKLSSEIFATYPGRRIRAPMIAGAVLNAECRLVQEVPMGDHTAFVGEVLDVTVDPSKEPVVLHRGPRHLGPRIARGRAIAVAVTPMTAAPGTRVRIEGELTGADRARATVDISVRTDSRHEIARGRATTGPHGAFELDLSLPADLPAGAYAVVATHGDAEGRARLEVRAEPRGL
jgi:flavin reductase (DIM6/NTAB) family NADH-FMN oxidoreductase RutF